MNKKLKDKIIIKYGSYAEFARVIRRSRSMVSEWLSGKVKPSLQTMQYIAKVTYGYIMPNDWVE